MTCTQPIIGDGDSKIADIADAATNTLIQTFAQEPRRRGFHGRVGHNRGLRRAIREMILRRLAERQNAHLTGEKDPISAPANGGNK